MVRISGGAQSPASGPGRRRDGTPTADRGCRGLVKVPGCWQASVAGVARAVAALDHRQTGVAVVRACSSSGSSSGSLSSRSVKPATKRRRRQCRAVPGGDRRQAVPGRRRDGAPTADRGCRGLVKVPGCWQASVAGVARAVAVLDHRQTGVAVVRACSSSGSSAGPSSSRSVKPATRRRRRQCRAVPGGDRWQAGQVEGEAAHRLPIGRAEAWSGCRGSGKPRLLWPGQGVGVLASRNRSHPLKESRQRDDLYGIVAKLGNDLTDAARCT